MSRADLDWAELKKQIEPILSMSAKNRVDRQVKEIIAPGIIAACEEIERLNARIEGLERGHVTVSEACLMESVLEGVRENERLRARIEGLEKENKSCWQTLHDLCREWHEDCEESCDSYCHAENCRSTYLAEAKKAMRLEIERLRAHVAELEHKK